MRGAPLAKAKEVIRQVLGDAAPRRHVLRSCASTTPRARSAPSRSRTSRATSRSRSTGSTRSTPAAATEMTTGIDAALALPARPGAAAHRRVPDRRLRRQRGRDPARRRRRQAGDVAAVRVRRRLGGQPLPARRARRRSAAAPRSTCAPTRTPRAAVDAFRRRIDAPVLTDLAIDWGGLAVSDVAPRALPDLFVGQPLVVAGHYARGGTATVTVRARRDGRDVSFAVPVTLADHDAARPAIAHGVGAPRASRELERAQLRADDPARVRGHRRAVARGARADAVHRVRRGRRLARRGERGRGEARARADRGARRGRERIRLRVRLVRGRCQRRCQRRLRDDRLRPTAAAPARTAPPAPPTTSPPRRT